MPPKQRKRPSSSPQKKMSKKPPPPPMPRRFTAWDDSFPTESFKTSRGTIRWIREGANIVDTDAIPPDEVARHLNDVTREVEEQKLVDGWEEFVGDAFLNTDLKKSIQGAAIRQGALIVPLEKIIGNIVENFDDFDSMCGKTFIGTVIASNAVISRDGFYYLTKQFDKLGLSIGEKKAYARDRAFHTTWVAISIHHLPQIKMVGFIDVLPYTREPFLSAFDIVVNNRHTDVTPPSLWSLVREWDMGLAAKTAQRTSLYVNYLCARRTVDESGVIFRGVGKRLASWAFAYGLGTYRGIVLEPVMGNFAKMPGEPWLGGPNMIVASLYHETFKFQRTFVIDDRVIDQHEKWIVEGSGQVNGIVIQRRIQAFYQKLFHNNQTVFLPDKPPPFKRSWHRDAERHVLTRMAATEGSSGGAGGAGGESDMSDREHTLALAVMFRPYPTEHDLRTIVARIIRA